MAVGEGKEGEKETKRERPLRAVIIPVGRSNDNVRAGNNLGPA